MRLKTFLGSLILCLALAWIVYAIFGHQAVRMIYEGKSIGLLERLVTGRATYPLEYYFQRADTLFIFIVSYLAIIAVSLYSFFLAFFKKEPRLAIRLFFVSVSVIFLTAMFLSPAVTQGDGPEYYKMTQSFFDHLSPDWQAQDEQVMDRLISKFQPSYYYRDFGYYKAFDGRLYCWHFWAYSLFNLPVKSFLHCLGLDEFKTFQITNVMLWLMALFCILFVSKLGDLQKMLFCFFLVFSPAFWYIRWPHPEIFSSSLVIMALVFMHRKSWPLAVLAAAIASTQNQPLIFLVFFLWFQGLKGSKRWRDFVVLSLVALPAVIPNIFYRVNFGVQSLLLARSTDFGSLSLWKVLELFFDLNLGMFPYVPMALVIFFAIVGRDAFVKVRFTLALQIFLVVILMMLSCTINPNWNNGSIGPSRYVIWLLPLIFFVIAADVSGEFLAARSMKPWIIALAIIFQGVVVCYGEFAAPSLSYLEHTPLARFVMNHCPALYNPSDQIFTNRVFHQGGYTRTPAVYYDGHQCRKALVANENEEKQLIDLCGCVPSRYKDSFSKKDNKGKLVYINY